MVRHFECRQRLPKQAGGEHSRVVAVHTQAAKRLGVGQLGDNDGWVQSLVQGQGAMAMGVGVVKDALGLVERCCYEYI